jgi:uncharacterized protein YbaR (Trm112 family)
MRNTMAHVILVCPCCASPVDAQPGETEQHLECTACHQTWRMVVDAERHAEYAL